MPDRVRAARLLRSGFRLAGAGRAPLHRLRLRPRAADRARGVRGRRRSRALWLGLATLFIDGTDGMLARRFRVKETIPWFDGALLDNIVDYLTYVFAPIVLLWTTGHLPRRRDRLGGRRAAAAGVVLPVLPARDAKTDRPLLPGLPELLERRRLLRDRPGRAPTVDRGRAASSSRCWCSCRSATSTRRGCERLRGVNLALTAVWLVTYAVLARCSTPTRTPSVVAASLAYLVYYVGLSLWLTARGAGRARRPLTRGQSRAPARSATRSAVSSMPQDSRTKPGGDGVAAPLRPPVDRAVHPAEAGRRGPQPGRARAACHGRLVGQFGRDDPVGPQHLPGRERERRVARPPRPPHAGDGRRAGQHLGHRRRVRRLPGQPQVQGAHRPVARATPRTGPGVLPLWLRQPLEPAYRSSSVVLTCPSRRSLCPVSALVSLPTVRSRAERPAAAGRAGWRWCCRRRRARPAARAARATAAMSQTSSSGLLGVSSSTSRTPSSPPAAAKASISDVAHVVDARCRTARARQRPAAGSCSSRPRAARTRSPAPAQASTAALIAAIPVAKDRHRPPSSSPTAASKARRVGCSVRRVGVGAAGARRLVAEVERRGEHRRGPQRRTRDGRRPRRPGPTGCRRPRAPLTPASPRAT